jgi:hypothetical protein
MNPRPRPTTKNTIDTDHRSEARRRPGEDQEMTTMIAVGRNVAMWSRSDMHTARAMDVQRVWAKMIGMVGVIVNGKVGSSSPLPSHTTLTNPSGSRRDYSDSESSLSPPRRERRKSLGEKALVALGLTGAGAGAEKERRRERHRSRSRGGRNRTPSSDSEGYYMRRSGRNGDRQKAAAAGAAGGAYAAAYNDDRTPNRYKPAAYIQNGDRDGGGRERGGGGSQVARRNNRSEVGQSKSNGGGKKDNSSSESSSSVCSSSEDERRTKKMKGKEYLTAGLAAVATIHAAHNVYASMEARDKRHLDVLKGEISPEEAKKKKNKARLQDAAAIGIAALGIKGAYSEWQEVQEHRSELAELNEERKKRHEKRVKKQQKLKGGGGGGGGGGDSNYGRSRSEGGRGNRRRDDSY